MSDEYVTIQQAMKVAGVSRRTIYNWLKAGKLETMRVPSGLTRIRKSSLLVKDTRYGHPDHRA